MAKTDRIVEVVNETIVITESVKTTINKIELERNLKNIQAKKTRLQEQNERILSEYNSLDAEEKEINELLSQFSIVVTPIEVISKDV